VEKKMFGRKTGLSENLRSTRRLDSSQLLIQKITPSGTRTDAVAGFSLQTLLEFEDPSSCFTSPSGGL
jgi:hypothetical protein